MNQSFTGAKVAKVANRSLVRRFTGAKVLLHTERAKIRSNCFCTWSLNRKKKRSTQLIAVCKCRLILWWNLVQARKMWRNQVAWRVARGPYLKSNVPKSRSDQQDLFWEKPCSTRQLRLQMASWPASCQFGFLVCWVYSLAHTSQ